jgi:hypothetical protein
MSMTIPASDLFNDDAIRPGQRGVDSALVRELAAAAPRDLGRAVGAADLRAVAPDDAPGAQGRDDDEAGAAGLVVILDWPAAPLWPRSGYEAWPGAAAHVARLRAAALAHMAGWRQAIDAALAVPRTLPLRVLAVPPPQVMPTPDAVLEALAAPLAGLADALRVNASRFHVEHLELDQVAGLGLVRVVLAVPELVALLPADLQPRRRCAPAQLEMDL